MEQLTINQLYFKSFLERTCLMTISSKEEFDGANTDNIDAIVDKHHGNRPYQCDASEYCTIEICRKSKNAFLYKIKFKPIMWKMHINNLYINKLINHLIN